jgi:hypothetical protein
MTASNTLASIVTMLAPVAAISIGLWAMARRENEEESEYLENAQQEAWRRDREFAAQEKRAAEADSDHNDSDPK